MFLKRKAKPEEIAPVLKKSMTVKGVTITVIKSDIIEMDVDALVIEADNHLRMEEGIAAVVKSRGGRIIEDEAIKQGPAKLGDIILTSAGSLKARRVIHAVMSGLKSRIDDAVIRKVTYNSLVCARDNKIFSLAFTALGCETGEFSYEVSTKLMAQEVLRFLKDFTDCDLRELVFVSYSEDVFTVFIQNIHNYLKHMADKGFQGPYVTVDGIVEYQAGIVLVERKNPPFGWALPGGFVDYEETVETAVVREVKEETGLDFSNIKQFRVYSEKNRDPRFHTVSVVFTGKGTGQLVAASDAKNANVFDPKLLPEPMAFDHRKIIEDYLAGKSASQE